MITVTARGLRRGTSYVGADVDAGHLLLLEGFGEVLEVDVVHVPQHGSSVLRELGRSFVARLPKRPHGPGRAGQWNAPLSAPRLKRIGRQVKARFRPALHAA